MAKMQLPDDFKDFFRFLVSNKKASARPKDLADVDALEIE
jgi:hypothetical protein